MKHILTEMIKPLLQKLLAYIDTNNYWAAYGLIILVAVSFAILGYILSWLLNKKKIQKEIEKLSVESKETSIKLLEKLHDKRNKYIKQSELIQLSVKLCIESLTKQDESSLEANRDELIDLYFNVLIKDFVEYIEVCEIFYKGEKHKIDACLVDDVIPFLETTVTFLSVVNNENILSILTKEAVALKKFSLNPVIRFTLENISIYRVLFKWKINQIIKNINLDKTI